MGGPGGRAKLEAAPELEGPLPLGQGSPPHALGLSWRSRGARRGPVRTCFIMASVASILGAEGKGATKS